MRPALETAPIRTRELPDAAYVDMSRALRAGLALSLVILFGSLVGYLIGNPAASFAEVVQANPILQYLGFVNLATGLAQGSPEAYLTLGILVLLATPIIRVLTGLYFFHENGEKVVARAAATVAVLLLLGLLVVGPLLH